MVPLKDDSRERQESGVSQAVNLVIVLLLGALLASVYVPLLQWLSRSALELEQLNNGGLIVIVALLLSLRRAIRQRRAAPQVDGLGVALIVVGFACLYAVRVVPALAVPLALLSFCLSFAGLSAFLFGAAGVRAMLPAMVGISLLGILVAVAPSLDWPFRAIAAKYSAGLLTDLGMHVDVALQAGQSPALVLAVGERVFNVAAECNGFGLFASSLLMAAILGFHYRLAWFDKVLLFLLAVPCAILSNALRIAGICLLATHVHWPYGLIHEGVGTISYAATLVVLWWLALRRAGPGEVAGAEETREETGSSGV